MAYLKPSQIKSSPWGIRKSRSVNLEKSIRKHGLQQPIKVRPIGRKKYQSICGDGRLEAVKALHMKIIPVIIENCSEEQALIKHGVENLHRNDWSELEQGEYFALTIKRTGMTYREMEDIFQVSRSLISERIALYEKLTPQAKKAVAKQKISPSAVEYALHKLPEEHALKAIETAVEQKLDLDGMIKHVNQIKPTVEIHEKANAFRDTPVRAAAISEGTLEPERFFLVFRFECKGRVQIVAEDRLTVESGHNTTNLLSEVGEQLKLLQEKAEPRDFVTVSLLLESPMKKVQEQ
jgi:ParB/RepB/Spo0J family partition protein